MDWTLFALYLLTAFVAGSTGAIFKPGDWYERLDKPWFTPPNWLFPLAWSTLYVLMALAAARVASGGDHPHAMALWALQIALNTLWSPIFFGLQNMRAGMIALVGLWLAVAATLVAFLQVDVTAGLLFVPYLAWVSVAGALNWSLMNMNRPDTRPAAG